VPDDVAHEDVDDVIVDWDGLAKSRHWESKKEEGRVKKGKIAGAIPINGQCFVRQDANRVGRSQRSRLKVRAL
jgi:hypothetical protein